MFKIDYSIARENKWFLWPCRIIAIATLAFLLLYDKADIHIYLNNLNSPWADHFFKHLTFLGDGNFTAIVIVLLLFVSFRKALTTLTFLVATGLVIQPLKRFVFPNELRPKAYFDGTFDLHFIEGVSVYSHNSFPSGHAASAFGLFLLFAFFSKKPIFKFIFFVLAVLTAYSRVYLSQHFLIDIFVGSIIGVTLALISHYLFKDLNAKWLNQSLLSLLKRNGN